VIPVHVLTGFLGSGKTTLLSRLLRDPAMAGTAVIINEFGEIALDHDLIETSDEALVQLTTGCLCCAVQNDLAATLTNLETRRRAGEIAFTRVVIETSGLADPAPILHTLMTDRSIGAAFSVGRVVTTVDAVAGARSLARYAEARKQVVLAERLLITKTDLTARPDALLSTLALMNRNASTAQANAGEVTPDALFGGDAGAWSWEARASEAEHTHGIGSIALVRDTPLPASALPLFLQGLAAHAGARLLRLKGMVAIVEAPDTPMVIHGVQHVFHPPIWRERWPSADRRTRLVLIGEKLPSRWPGLLLDAIVDEVAAAQCVSK
jgi:G3E family GTPase